MQDANSPQQTQVGVKLVEGREDGEEGDAGREQQTGAYSWIWCGQGSHGLRDNMSLQEELELSPWAKYRRYGIFPWKLTLHITLVVLVTAQALLSVQRYGSYSRDMGLNWINLFFPSDYDDYQTQYTPDNEYYIFTMNDTVADAQRLVDSYYSLPETAVNEMEVANTNSSEANNGIPLPTVKVHTADGTEKYTLYNSTSGWPLAADSPDVQSSTSLRHYFNDLRRMTFKFVVLSYGRDKSETGYSELCVLWNVIFRYNLGARGQILVSSGYNPRRFCHGESLDTDDHTYVLCCFLAAFACIYQALLVKATVHHFNILTLIHQVTSGGHDVGAETLHSAEEAFRRGKTRSLSGDAGRPSRQLKQPLLDADFAPVTTTTTGNGGLEAINANANGYDDDVKDTNAILAANSAVNRRRHRSVSFDRMQYMRGTSIASVPQVSNTEAVQEAWATLSWSEKMHLFNLWFVASSIANICIVIFSIHVVTQRDRLSSENLGRAFLGLSVMFYWIALAQYFEFNARYYVLIATIKRGFPHVLQFLTGVLPLFLGYAFLGLTLFGDRIALFGSFPATLVTLFAVVNGDVVHDTFDACSFMPVVGDIYLSVYMIIFTYVVLMTIIAIVEEAFFSSHDSKIGDFVSGVVEGEEDGHGGGGGGGGGDDDVHANGSRAVSRPSYVNPTLPAGAEGNFGRPKTMASGANRGAEIGAAKGSGGMQADKVGGGDGADGVMFRALNGDAQEMSASVTDEDGTRPAAVSRRLEKKLALAAHKQSVFTAHDVGAGPTTEGGGEAFGAVDESYSDAWDHDGAAAGAATGGAVTGGAGGAGSSGADAGHGPVHPSERHTVSGLSVPLTLTGTTGAGGSPSMGAGVGAAMGGGPGGTDSGQSTPHTTAAQESTRKLPPRLQAVLRQMSSQSSPASGRAPRSQQSGGGGGSGHAQQGDITGFTNAIVADVMNRMTSKSLSKDDAPADSGAEDLAEALQEAMVAVIESGEGQGASSPDDTASPPDNESTNNNA